MMEIAIEPSSVVLTAIGIVITVLGFFLTRMIKQVDTKLDHLIARDTEVAVDIGNLRARIIALERAVFPGTHE